MGDTYTQCYFQLVFAVRNRNALIRKEWKDQLEKYISGIIRNNGHKVLALGTMPDHIHILLGYHLNQLIPDLVEQIKTSSNAWVKENRLSRFRFGWQNGYGVFTYSRSQIDAVIKYILNQEKHHKKELFREEYLRILKKSEIEYKEEYLFDFFDDVYGWE